VACTQYTVSSHVLHDNEQWAWSVNPNRPDAGLLARRGVEAGVLFIRSKLGDNRDSCCPCLLLLTVYVRAPELRPAKHPPGGSQAADERQTGAGLAHKW
jgi:hypothetical protein